MKVIDLLNKIANGEAPKEIKAYNKIYKWEENLSLYICGGGQLCFDYFVENNKLNDEVEIIEEDKKIEPLINCVNAIRPNEMTSYYEKEKLEDIVKHNFDVIHKKINEIIDYLEEKEQC